MTSEKSEYTISVRFYFTLSYPMVTGTKFQKHVKDYITQHEHTLTNLNHFKRYYTMKKNLFLRAITISHKWPPESKRSANTAHCFCRTVGARYGQSYRYTARPARPKAALISAELKRCVSGLGIC